MFDRRHVLARHGQAPWPQVLHGQPGRPPVRVRDGHIEVGDQESFSFVARSLDYGGLAFEDDRPNTLAEALAALEKGIRAWYEEQGIEME